MSTPEVLMWRWTCLPGARRTLRRPKGDRLLFDGALVHAVIEGTADPLRDARSAAVALLGP